MPEWLLLAGSVLSGGLVILFGYRTFRLTYFQISKERAEAQALKKAELGANFYTLGANKQRLKIFNKGKAQARNVRIAFPEDIDCLDPADIDAKFPLELLAVHQSVELHVYRHLGMTRTKYKIELTWDDDFQQDNTVVLYPTI